MQLWCCLHPRKNKKKRISQLPNMLFTNLTASWETRKKGHHDSVLTTSHLLCQTLVGISAHLLDLFGHIGVSEELSNPVVDHLVSLVRVSESVVIEASDRFFAADLMDFRCFGLTKIGQTCTSWLDQEALAPEAPEKFRLIEKPMRLTNVLISQLAASIGRNLGSALPSGAQKSSTLQLVDLQKDEKNE